METPALTASISQNGTYFLDERDLCRKGTLPEPAPVEYQPDAPTPTKWLEFLDGSTDPEDILTLQEYLAIS